MGSFQDQKMLRDPKGNTNSGGGGFFRTLYPPDKELILGMAPPSCLQPQGQVPSPERAGNGTHSGVGDQRTRADTEKRNIP